ncbi:hypothetical protein TELCIR_20658 [Teladorsagia circumcincta]|uniref:Uncharacterized protein n=1 Tax=Teladorsagia circumcincta TaxID=45464 RepID=A0A2G9TIZ2_TELCI|nr:hypothetical protein TELCIR_20658 [Teladorsagia circumcincta]
MLLLQQPLRLTADMSTFDDELLLKPKPDDMNGDGTLLRGHFAVTTTLLATGFCSHFSMHGVSSQRERRGT